MNGPADAQRRGALVTGQGLGVVPDLVLCSGPSLAQEANVDSEQEASMENISP